MRLTTLGVAVAVMAGFVAGPAREAPARRHVALSSVVAYDRILRRDSIYDLEGDVVVAPGVTLTIEPGTRIEADAASRASLIISRGANLVARGTLLEPIVFTCNAAVKVPGCWGGLAIEGFALLNRGTFPEVACPEKQFGADPGHYGGCINQDTSGVLRYVRVEYAGGVSGGGARPALALLGVGSGTVVDSVQVHRSLGDGLFVSGGTVDLRSIVLTGNSGHGLSWADGWVGRMQFLIVQQDAAAGDAVHGINEADDPASLPRSHPQVYHVTITGPSGGAGLFLGRGTGGVLRNVIVLSPGGAGLDIDDAATCAAAADGFLHLDHAIFFGGAPDFSGDTDCLDEVVWATDPVRANRVADPQLVAPANTLTPDVRPLESGAAATGYLLPPSDGFFDLSATFVGAVAPANGTRSNVPWYSGWTIGW